uniref:Uncharacterized protein n=1 Tax=Trichuris muris TaxID=70415 RepID=A0A5S6QU28_TRIMR
MDALRRMPTGNLNQRLASFLLSQHTTPCVTTGRSPAELLINHRLNMRLDHLHPDFTCERQRKIDNIKTSNAPRKLKADQPQLVKNCSTGSRWTPGVITEPSDLYGQQLFISNVVDLVTKQAYNHSIGILRVVHGTGKYPDFKHEEPVIAEAIA